MQIAKRSCNHHHHPSAVRVTSSVYYQPSLSPSPPLPAVNVVCAQRSNTVLSRGRQVYVQQGAQGRRNKKSTNFVFQDVRNTRYFTVLSRRNCAKSTPPTSSPPPPPRRLLNTILHFTACTTQPPLQGAVKFPQRANNRVGGRVYTRS